MLFIVINFWFMLLIGGGVWGGAFGGGRFVY